MTFRLSSGILNIRVHEKSPLRTVFQITPASRAESNTEVKMIMEQTTIYLTDHNILPDTEMDYTDILNRLLSEAEDGTVFHFAQGTYHFHAVHGTKGAYSLSNSEPIDERTLSLVLKNKKNIVLDGNGAAFLYHGHLQPITFDSCQNITLKNLTIDWEKPLVSEAILLAQTPDYMDVLIDQQLYPCFVKNFCLYFDIGDGEVSELTYGGHTVYDGKTLTVLPDSADKLHIRNVEQIANDRFRLYFSDMLTHDIPSAVGDIVVLRHNKRIHCGIFAENCQNLIYEDLSVHSCGGICMLFQFCENICCRRLQIAANRKKGRQIACTRDDGMQFSNCRGHITVDSCFFHGLQDSPVNVHGTSVCVHRVIDDHTLECQYMNYHTCDFKNWAEPGHKIQIINRKNMVPIQEAEVESFLPVSKEHFRITFREPICHLTEPDILNLYALENISNTPSVEIYRNHFGSCRSRGVLVTTPKPVRIEDNLFASSGAAILIAGDASDWFESGGCRDVTIQNNTFTDDCALSGYQYSHAVISICPSIMKPMPNHTYHSNIRIYNNTFHSADMPILYAYSVRHLEMRENSIFHSERQNHRKHDASLFLLHHCQDVALGDNKIVGMFSITTKFDVNKTKERIVT